MRSATTTAGIPAATAYDGMLPRATLFAPITTPRPMSVPRVMVTLVASQQSGPIRTGDFTRPWSLIGRPRSSVLWSKSQM